MGKINNKWTNGALAALLIHCSIGSVYVWSLFVNPISKYIGCKQSDVQFAFSLAIFFLGISAAFGGKLVEKNIKLSSIISIIFFCSGLVLTGISIQFKSLIGIYLGYGLLMGIGLGIGYITPVKTLMMWFKDNKGLATGIAITGFGFASTIASPIITYFISNTGLVNTFYALSLVYLFPMILASILLKKPYKDDETIEEKFKYRNVIKDTNFIKIWFIFFINITCGLALISSASPILKENNIDLFVITVCISVMGIFNGVGRLFLSTISDKMNHRKNMYKYILVSGFILSLLTYLLIGRFSFVLIITLCLISAIYGAGFSCLPALLSDIYGMKNISKIHGLTLTAWAVAGLVGNQISALIYNATGSYNLVFLVISILYLLSFTVARFIKD